MAITKINSTRLTNFTTRVMKNKTVLRGLEKISEHGISFSAGTSLLLSVGLRPLAIATTPNVEKENKQYAIANSICSGLTKFAIVEAIALPLEYAVKKIDNNPGKYLKKQTIQNLTESTKNIANSRSYKLLTQFIKQSSGILTAIPKTILTLSLIPILMDNLFFKKNKKNNNIKTSQNKPTNQKINFTGSITDKISRGLGKIIDNNKIQNLAKKYQHKDKNIAKHTTAATDILLTSSFAYQTSNSKKIKENRKKALIYNNIVSTVITIAGGYGLDNLLKNKTGKFIEKFKQINAADPKLAKYIEGINILRPALLFAGIYYGILPIFSTFMGEKIDKFIENKTAKLKNNPT